MLLLLPANKLLQGDLPIDHTVLCSVKFWLKSLNSCIIGPTTLVLIGEEVDSTAVKDM